jgi:DNA (cytosine-5)-methyltransferase 1
MVARLQGWSDLYPWTFTGRKTARYRQIGNAFPPPMAAALGAALIRAFRHEGARADRSAPEHDPIYKVLRDSTEFLTPNQIARRTGTRTSPAELERRLSLLGRDFEIEVRHGRTAPAYKLGKFKAFIGQKDHNRQSRFLKHRAKRS